MGISVSVSVPSVIIFLKVNLLLFKEYFLLVDYYLLLFSGFY